MKIRGPPNRAQGNDRKDAERAWGGEDAGRGLPKSQGHKQGARRAEKLEIRREEPSVDYDTGAGQDAGAREQGRMREHGSGNHPR